MSLNYPWDTFRPDVEYVLKYNNIKYQLEMEGHYDGAFLDALDHGRVDLDMDSDETCIIFMNDHFCNNPLKLFNVINALFDK